MLAVFVQECSAGTRHVVETFQVLSDFLPDILVLHSQGLELAVPGTYLAGEPVVTIASFAPQLHVITSKQRPRKLTIHGSDGAEYMFLLKVSYQTRRPDIQKCARF